MVALLREFPGVRMTFNLVPSLLVQLEAFAEDRARDRYPGAEPQAGRRRSTEATSTFILENFFHAQRQRMIDAYPRYAELLARRGGAPSTPAERRAAAARFSADDLRDLQVWHKLAWIDPFYLDGDPRIRGAGRQGARLHRGRQGAAARGRARAAEQGDSRSTATRRRAGRSSSRRRRSTIRFCRCCATPTSTCARIPTRAMPRQPFRHPEDAARAARRAPSPVTSGCSAQRPVGLWPSEGSVSDAMVPLVGDGRLPVDGDRRD